MTTDLMKFDRLEFNCDYIRKFCSNNECDANEQLSYRCNQLIEVARLIDKISKESMINGVETNGFVIFLRVITTYTDRLVYQIRTKNRTDQLFLKLFRHLFFYGNWLIEMHSQLQSEKELVNRQDSLRAIKTDHSIMVKQFSINSRKFYDLLNTDNETLSLLFSNYVAFWTPKDLQKLFKLVNFLIAFTFKLPWSISALWSNKSLGKYCAKSYKSANLQRPFSIWHATESWLVCFTTNYIVNFGVHVKSDTLRVPKQNRFRLTYKGQILDLDRMTKEQLDDYYDDEEEQSRQNARPIRHANKTTIKCRYSYISDKSKIAESLNKIRNKKMLKSKIKVQSYQKNLNLTNDGEYLNGKEMNGSNFQTRVKLEYNRMKHSEFDDFEVKIGTIDEQPALPEVRLLDKNVEANSTETLLIYIHGGGFFTQGSTSCECYLRKIVEDLGGIPILAVDYSLTVPFPVPLQELLDVYLWVTSGRDEVKQALGFHPKKIVVSGDSCGGFYSLCLTILINEFNKIVNLSPSNGHANGNQRASIPHLPLPTSIVAVYPVYSLVNLTPSKTMFAIEPLIEIHLYMIMLSKYGANMTTLGDFRKIESTALFQSIVSKNEDKAPNRDDFISLNNGNAKSTINKKEAKAKNDSMPWYSCDYETFYNYGNYIKHFFNNPFINPVLYQDKFGELKNVFLYALVGNSDFLLDESIELFAQWEGKSRLDVFSNLTHAFLQLATISNECKDAFETVVERYQEACGLI